MHDVEAAAIETALAEMPVVDCHEHTFLPEARPARVDLGTLIANSDLADDLISAGMPADARAALTWDASAPWLERVRNTGFHRSLILAFRALFGFEDDRISRDAWTVLSDCLADGNARQDWYDHVLHHTAGVQVALRVQGDEADALGVPRRWFRPILRVDPWIVTTDRAERDRLAERAGGSAASLGGWIDALDRALAQARAAGAVGVKSMLAYQRTLAHGRPDHDEAARLYVRTVRSPAEELALQDHLVHAVADRAGAHGLPWQIHVGIGSWQTNIVGNADPVMLNPLVEAHRGTTFVLLHGGYPYLGEVASMAKNHPNVVLECGWLAYLAPAAYRRAMGEWLDAIPASKLLAVGADCAHVEQTLGAVILTRRQLALALADKVRDAGWSAHLVDEVGRRLLGGNARELYALGVADEGGGARDRPGSMPAQGGSDLVQTSW